METKRNGNLVRKFSTLRGLEYAESYYTVLFCWSADGTTPIHNITRYSVTTSKQQSRYVNMPVYELEQRGYEVVIVDDMPRGATIDDLRRAAIERPYRRRMGA